MGTGGLGTGGRGPGMKARDWGPDNPNTQLLITNYNNKILVESTFNESMIANLLLINFYVFLFLLFFFVSRKLNVIIFCQIVHY